MATAKTKLVQWAPADIKKELLKKYPAKVARKRAKQILINEALEIVKEFSDGEGTQFVNGILDAAAKELRPAEASPRRRPRTECAAKEAGAPQAPEAPETPAD